MYASYPRLNPPGDGLKGASMSGSFVTNCAMFARTMSGNRVQEIVRQLECVGAEFVSGD